MWMEGGKQTFGQTDLEPGLDAFTARSGAPAAAGCDSIACKFPVSDLVPPNRLWLVAPTFEMLLSTILTAPWMRRQRQMCAVRGQSADLPSKVGQALGRSRRGRPVRVRHLLPAKHTYRSSRSPTGQIDKHWRHCGQTGVWWSLESSAATVKKWAMWRLREKSSTNVNRKG